MSRKPAAKTDPIRKNASPAKAARAAPDRAMPVGEPSAGLWARIERRLVDA
jgi:hypothetical protein